MSQVYYCQYKERLRLAGLNYAAELEQIKGVYENTARTGLIDRLEDQAEKTGKLLDLDVKKWEKWQKDVIEEINKADARLRQFQSRGSHGLGFIDGRPVQGPIDPG